MASSGLGRRWRVLAAVFIILEEEHAMSERMARFFASRAGNYLGGVFIGLLAPLLVWTRSSN